MHVSVYVSPLWFVWRQVLFPSALRCDHWRGPARGMARVRAVLHRVRGVYVCGMLFGVWSEGDEDMMRGGASARDWAHEGGRSGPEDGGRRSISRGGRSWVCDCVRSVRPIRPTDPHRDAERAGAGWRAGAGEGARHEVAVHPIPPEWAAPTQRATELHLSDTYAPMPGARYHRVHTHTHHSSSLHTSGPSRLASAISQTVVSR